jgi:hypothetical protein
MRLVEAGRLARLHPHLRLLVSGAGEPDYVLRALGGGIAPQRVTVETNSQSTYDNAVNSRNIVHPKAGERWLLVTSAIHMPRSMGAFRKVGFWLEPWPIDDGSAKLPEAVAHEWAGLVWYWISGRSNSPFPSPASQASGQCWAGHEIAGPGWGSAALGPRPAGIPTRAATTSCSPRVALAAPRHA